MEKNVWAQFLIVKNWNQGKSYQQQNECMHTSGYLEAFKREAHNELSFESIHEESYGVA